jgi:hypothetical protein
MCTAFRGYARFMLERSEESLLEMRRAAEWLEARDTGLFSGLNYGCFAEAFASAGQALEARQYAQRALARSEAGDLLGQTMAYRALARLAAEAGPEDAERDGLLELARQSANARGSRRDLALTELLAAELWAMHEARTQDAAPCAERALAELEAMELRYHAGCARALCAAIGTQTRSAEKS